MHRCVTPRAKCLSATPLSVLRSLRQKMPHSVNASADNLGRLIPRYKIRTKKKVIREIVKMMERYARGGLDYDGKCYISMSACYDDARAVADLVERCFPRLNGRVVINSIGTTIGSHTGPGTVALFFWGSERTD